MFYCSFFFQAMDFFSSCPQLPLSTSCMVLDLYRLLPGSLLFCFVFFFFLIYYFFISAYCFILTLNEEVRLSKSDPLSSLWGLGENGFLLEADHQYDWVWNWSKGDRGRIPRGLRLILRFASMPHETRHQSRNTTVSPLAAWSLLKFKNV